MPALRAGCETVASQLRGLALGAIALEFERQGGTLRSARLGEYVSAMTSGGRNRTSGNLSRTTLGATWGALTVGRKRAWIRMWVFAFVGSVIVIVQIPKPLLFRGAVFTGWFLLVAAVSAWGVWTGAKPGGD